MRGLTLGCVFAAAVAMAAGSAQAEEYYALGTDFSWPGNSLSVAREASNPQLVRIFGRDEDARSAWTQSAIDDNWFRIHVKSLGSASCLTLVPHDVLGTIAAMVTCAPDNPLQAWRQVSISATSGRLYNAGMDQNTCLTEVPEEGQYYGYITMTECGQGNVATETWISEEVK